MKNAGVIRIIDANFNRLREALRVCEDVSRFVMEDRTLSFKFKNARHQTQKVIGGLTRPGYEALVLSRDTKSDPGRRTIPHELERQGICGILGANIQRTKESLRVLEEFFKIIDFGASARFKDIRFKIYDIEKLAVKKVRAFSHCRQRNHKR